MQVFVENGEVAPGTYAPARDCCPNTLYSLIFKLSGGYNVRMLDL